MNKGLALVTHPPSIAVPFLHSNRLKLFISPKFLHAHSSPHSHVIRYYPLCCTKSTPSEPPPITYASSDNNFLQRASNIFETLNSNTTIDGQEAEEKLDTNELTPDTSKSSAVQFQFLKWPLWLLGPSLLLLTGMVPTLWLPISSIFLGANIASLLSLIGLDCIFNLGATLFLLMADAAARPKDPSQLCKSKAPFSYQFWNMVANITGFIIPFIMLYGSEKGLFQPQLPFISAAVLLGPYFLLLSIQVLTEMLTWHWKSPVWLVTPVVYEAYRVLQLMRGLKLGLEVGAPAWMLNLTRGLVSWWVLILGVQIMRVAWFAGFTAQARKDEESSFAHGL